MGHTHISYYEVLGVEKDCDSEEVKKAYRKQSLRWHPDKNSQHREEAEEMFKQISEAYQVLSDDEKRQVYDRYGYEGLQNGGTSTYDNYDYDHGHGHHFAHHPFAHFHFESPESLFKRFFGGVDPFEQLLGASMHSGSSFGHRSRGFYDPFLDHSHGMRMNSFMSPFSMDPFSQQTPAQARSNFGRSFSSSASMGSGLGGFTSTSTSVQIINGQKTTTTKTTDGQGNTTVTTTHPDGTTSTQTYHGNNSIGTQSQSQSHSQIQYSSANPNRRDIQAANEHHQFHPATQNGFFSDFFWNPFGRF